MLISTTEAAVRSRLARKLNRDGYRLRKPRSRHESEQRGPYQVIDVDTGGVADYGELDYLVEEWAPVRSLEASVEIVCVQALLRHQP